jgi:hypothetical protein
MDIEEKSATIESFAAARPFSWSGGGEGQIWRWLLARGLEVQ